MRTIVFGVLFFIATSLGAQIDMTNHGGGGGQHRDGQYNPSRKPGGRDTYPGGYNGNGGDDLSGEDLRQPPPGPTPIPPPPPPGPPRKHQFVPPIALSIDDYNRTKDYYVKRAEDLNLKIESKRLEIKDMDHYEERSAMLNLSRIVGSEARLQFMIHNFNEAKEMLIVAESILDFATSMIPGVGWARDVYETMTGTNAITGEKLTKLEWTLAVGGFATGGLMSKLKRPLHIMTRAINSSGLLGAFDVYNKSEKFIKNNDVKTIEKVKDFFTRHKIDKSNHQKFYDSFEQPIFIHKFDKDKLVYRYHGPNSRERGHWVTTEGALANPKESLALPDHPYPEPQKWIIPKDTEVLYGTVGQHPKHPDWGKGGANQIFVPDPNVLRKVL